MLYFKSDYTCGAHPEVLEALVATNNIHTPGYGDDEYSKSAAELILKHCGISEGKVYFLEGGTQTNALVIDRLLSRNDGVIAADTSHINVHEAGAIEAWGHKILVIPNRDGKIIAREVDEYVTLFYSDDTHEHMVRPSMVYISFPTELGTVYSKEELIELHAVCKKHGMPLYIDGARMAFGLGVKENDIDLKFIASHCDVFYIGGTKCGAMFGEAVVTANRDLLPRFYSLIKIHGGLLAKGRILGVQFLSLFKDGLYFKIGEKGVTLARKLKEGFEAKGYRCFIDSPTNQQFFTLPNNLIERLSKDVAFEYWGPPGESESNVRFVVGWSTTEEDVEKLLDLL